MSETPDLTRKVLGYRTFALDDGDLRSISASTAWMPGVNKARCQPQTSGLFVFGPSPTPKPEHASPDSACDCGLYGYHKPPENWTYGGLDQKVGAVILAWGKMEIHHSGFRSEFAEIALLLHDAYCGPSWLSKTKMAGALYGVETVCVDDLASQAGVLALGEHVPESLRPEPQPEVKAALPEGSLRITMPTWSSYLPSAARADLRFRPSPGPSTKQRKRKSKAKRKKGKR